MTLATHEEVIEPEIVRTFSEHVEIIKADFGQIKQGAISAGRHLIAAKADVDHTEWLPLLAEVGINERVAQQLMAVGRNDGLTNTSNCSYLPAAARALYELSRLDPSDIEAGIESGAIHPGMKIEEAKAFARSEWPVVPEPTPEERFQRLEKVRAQNIADGISKPPRTREEQEADGRAFVESLIGGTKRQAEPATPEDQFAKALNAVGAAIRVNHGVNEAALNEDGWNVLRALGLR